jgi:hypothetical protein
MRTGLITLILLIYVLGLNVKLPKLPEKSPEPKHAQDSASDSFSRARTMGAEIPGLLAMPSSFHSLFELGTKKNKGMKTFWI